MGLAKMNVWIHDENDPCRISENRWWVVVTDCQNRMVKWCQEEYLGKLATCGHAMFTIPPGCYVVWAAKGLGVHEEYVKGNYITHFAFVSVRCEETACVHLYAPPYKLCWDAFRFATEILDEQGLIDPEAAQALTQAMDAVIERVPTTRADANMRKILKVLPEIVKQQPDDGGDDGCNDTGVKDAP